MQFELRRIEPLRAANVGALVYGLLIAAFVLILAPFLLIAALFAGDESGLVGPAVMVLIVLLYPVLGLVMGWLSGFLTGVIYNFVIRWSGGLQFELTERPAGD